MQKTTLWAAAALLLFLTGCGASRTTPTCDPCVEGLVCDPVSRRCVTPVGPDAGTACTGDAQCEGATPRCLVEQQRCVGCLTSADCAAGSCDPLTNECVPLSDACQAVRTQLDLSTGRATVRGDTSRAADDTRLSCALPGSPGADVVYSLVVPSVQRLVATVVADPGSGFHPVLALRSACESPDSEAGLGCSYAAAGAFEASLTVEALSPGTYYLWVDGEGPESGPFTLDVRLEASAKVDRCDATMELRPGAAPIDVVGDTSSLHDDGKGTCGGDGAPDAVYALRLDAPRRVRLEALGTGGFRPTVYLRSICADATPAAEEGCAEPNANTGAAVLEVGRLEAGTWFVFVDGSTATPAGRYRLRISTADPVPPPTNDSCAAPAPLPVPPGGLGRIVATGDTTAAANDALGCGGTGPDLVYNLTLTEARHVAVRVTPFAGTAFQPVVTLRKPGKCTSEQTADQLGCVVAAQPGLPAVATFPRVPPGAWSLWVDGAVSTAGPFDLSVELTLPPVAPPNDTCSAPAPISLGSGPVTVTGSTLGALDDQASCEYDRAPDVVYALQVPARQSVGIDVRAVPGSMLKPVVALRADGVCAASVLLPFLACGFSDAQVPDRSVLLLPDVPPGQYFLWVDGDYGTQGPFTLRLTPGPALTAAPSNDSCSGSIVPVLTAGVPMVGDTRAARHDATGVCGLPDGANGEYGPDVAFTFTLAAQRAFSVTVTPDAVDGALMRPVVYVRGPATGCSAFGTARGCQAATGFGQSVTLPLPNLSPGTYTVWVDGAGVSSGKFSVTLQ